MLGAGFSTFSARSRPRASRPAVVVALLAGSLALSACGNSSSNILPLQAASSADWTCKDWQDAGVLGPGFVYNQPASDSTGEHGLGLLTDDLHQQHSGPFVNSNGYKLSFGSETHVVQGFISELCRGAASASYAPGPKAVALAYRDLLKYEQKASDATASQSAPVVSPSLPPPTQNSGTGNSGSGGGGGGTGGGSTGGGNTGNTGGGTTGGGRPAAGRPGVVTRVTRVAARRAGGRPAAEQPGAATPATPGVGRPAAGPQAEQVRPEHPGTP